MLLDSFEIKNIRVNELELTQQQFADKLDVTLRTVQKWESNDVKISITNINKINQLRRDPADFYVLEKGSEEYKRFEMNALDVVEQWEKYMQIPLFKLKIESVSKSAAIAMLKGAETK